MNCPICYKDFKATFRGTDGGFSCGTCVDGGICLHCLMKLNGFNIGELKNPDIRCPCCRTKNWRWLKKEILMQYIHCINQCRSENCGLPVFYNNADKLVFKNIYGEKDYQERLGWDMHCDMIGRVAHWNHIDIHSYMQQLLNE